MHHKGTIVIHFEDKDPAAFEEVNQAITAAHVKEVNSLDMPDEAKARLIADLPQLAIIGAVCAVLDKLTSRMSDQGEDGKTDDITQPVTYDSDRLRMTIQLQPLAHSPFKAH